VAYDLNAFGLSEMTRLGMAVRSLAGQASCMEQVAEALVRYFYESFSDAESGAPVSALVRLYLTMPFEELDPELRAFAQAQHEATPLASQTRCLTLLASAEVIPLPSPKAVDSIPMVSQLLKQLGVDVATVITPDPEVVLELEQKTYNVFFVEDAEDSPHIPAQENFVLPYRVRSVLGFGGLLPTGNVFAILMFTKTPIERTTAELFRNAAMNAKVALLPFADGPIFRGGT
jgi:hypothetical protein